MSHIITQQDVDKFVSFINVLTPDEVQQCGRSKYFESKLKPTAQDKGFLHNKYPEDYVTCPVCPVANASTKLGFIPISAFENTIPTAEGTGMRICKEFGLNPSLMESFIEVYDRSTMPIIGGITTEQQRLDGFNKAIEAVKGRVGK